jgi:hypothetical protein
MEQRAKRDRRQNDRRVELLYTGMSTRSKNRRCNKERRD